MKRAIVTGPTGALGTALINELIDQNVEVLAFTRKESSRNERIPKNKLVTIKYCSLDDLKKISNEESIDYDVFYHLAWAGTTGQGRNDEVLQKKNIEYSLDAVDCAARFGCRKFVGIGSQAEYGRKDVPLSSLLECKPENEYGKAKLEAGIKTAEKAFAINMEHNWIRVLSVYGPNDGDQSLISFLIRKLKAHESPDLTQGEQVWDYLYSKDAARALYLIGERGMSGKTYVLGSGNSRRLKEYIIEIRDLISPETPLNFGAKQYGDKQVMYLKADISELHKDTGWLPQYSFINGIREMIDE